VAVDDCGNVVNPAIVDGQVHGGVIHSVGQALYEGVIYDEDGQLLTSSFVDYLIPGAPDVPSVETYRTETPSPTNPLGVKGIGEAGTIAATAAIVGAVCDATGVRDIDMPLQPERVWRAMSKGGAA
jgi:carbon-monoxide dehydrogenase large subunit